MDIFLCVATKISYPNFEIPISAIDVLKQRKLKWSVSLFFWSTIIKTKKVVLDTKYYIGTHI